MKTLHFGIIIKSVSMFVIITGVFILLCIPVSLYYHSSDLIPILLSSFIAITIGIIGWTLSGKYRETDIGRKESYLIVFITWIVVALVGTLPYILSNSISTFTDSFFESISGFTTTGASILNDIEAVPPGILFWRSLTHWIGGIGIIVFSVAILPFFGIGGMQLFIAEVPGPTKDKLHPRIKETARSLWGIYLALTIIQVIFLGFGGMNLFESICHAFSTISSGGFSTRNASIAAFSPYIHYVTSVFMIFAGTNFTLFYHLIKGNAFSLFKNEEFKLYLGTIFTATLIITITLLRNGFGHPENVFRNVFFQVCSIISCTGFSTCDYMQWPSFAWYTIFLLMFVGGSAGSTAGGIKIIRHLLLFKNSYLEFRSLLHPSAFIPLRYNQRVVSESIRNNILAILFLYLITFALGSMLLNLTGVEKITAMGSVASCMGNIGPGLNLTGPATNYSGLSEAAKWILSALMLVGRLELLTVYVLFTASFWKK